MHEPPAHNPILAPLLSSQAEPEGDTSDTIPFLPPLVGRTLIAAWILLFSCRWLVVQGLIAAGFFGPDSPMNSERIDKLDRIDTAMGRCYLFLLSVTLVIGVLRIAGGRRQTPAGSARNLDVQAESDSARAATGKTASSDRGGKQA
jgi:hypothetical protein